MLPETLLSEAMAQRDTAIRHRRALHTLAEVGFDLPKTIEYVKNCLQSEGLSPRVCGGCGVLADIPCPNPDAKTLLLRADMDALPMEEESGLPFAAKNGNMHACGHDMHAAMLLSAVSLLARHKEDLPCHVRIMLQGAEEVLGGAYRMLAEGAAEGVSAAFMLHVSTASDARTGTLFLPPSGYAAPEAAFFRIRIQGKGGHGALPEESADALRVAALTLSVLSSLHTPSVTLSIGSLQAGRAANVLPDSAHLSGTVRSLKEGALDAALARIESAARGVASALGARAEMAVTARCPRLLIHEDLRQSAYRLFGALLGEGRVCLTEKASGASEDFAFISERCPSLTVGLAAGKREDGYTFPLHHPRTCFDEEALPFGAAVYAAFALGHANL